MDISNRFEMLQCIAVTYTLIVTIGLLIRYELDLRRLVTRLYLDGLILGAL